MTSVSTPIKAFTPRRKLESDNLEELRAKIIRESSNLYKAPTLSSSPLKPSKLNNVTISTPSLKQEELNANSDRGKTQGFNKFIKSNGFGSYQPTSSNSNNNNTTTNLPSIEWEHPDLLEVEKRIVNKELEAKKAVINILLLLSSRLIYNFITLIWNKLIESSINFELEFNFNRVLLLVQILCVWNISYSIYKIVKPQDEFSDLNLTPTQRELLGLKQIPTTKTKSQETQAPPPTTTTTITKPTTKTTELKENPSLKPLKKSNTPIASPMSSPSKNFSPSKKANSSSTSISNISNTNLSQPLTNPISNSSVSNLKIQSLKESSTPTYIPSPKYYYRMDSPSRSRRRNI